MKSLASTLSYSGMARLYMPWFTLTDIPTLSLLPRLVVIRITPLEARLPYRAAEVASFSTVRLSMSFGFRSEMLPPKGTPSMT